MVEAQISAGSTRIHQQTVRFPVSGARAMLPAFPPMGSGSHSLARRTTRPAPTVEFVDVDFSTTGAQGVIDAVRDRLPDAPFAYIVTPNVDHVVRLQRSRSDLWPAYRAAWMTLCDSRILARMARSKGFALPVVPGSNLTSEMFDHVIDPCDRVAIVGGDASAIAELARRYGLRDICHYDPPMGFIHDPIEVAKAVRFLIATHARYSFLAVGSPQQEILAYRAARAGGATGIGLCVGASLDFLTGAQDRAPEMMQRMSLEWLYRLGSDPRRFWRRYLVEGPEIFQIARSWSRARAQQ